MPSALIVPFDEIPAEPVMGLNEIQKVIPQRYEMQQLDGILIFDDQRGIAVGYKDLTENEFWVRGHIPGRPLMPGVIMCESAAQLCAFYFGKTQDTGDHFLGFGGMDNVRFRGTVAPGNRFITMVRKVNIERRLKVFDAQGVVDGRLVFEARISGIQI